MREGQFSLRATLVFLVLVALGLAWFRYAVIVPMQKSRALDAFDDALHAAGGGWSKGPVLLGPGVDDKWLEEHLAPMTSLFSSDDNLVHGHLLKFGLA